ncbi:FtsW/RodA/SpoVE family cell cycle protein [Clostridium gasigenes]|uniref:FtsW/RodA/SpoVE family cell cycle protein n=1 Tax=Clostridium gasigenes TaxID=94869 RepID=UPI001C0E1DBB|nr:FtsW/RodA/SpoVE family cell cycle protein [Clostridium gasigenes]MBU3088206.1 FtsW/RodA/SpoVE family cell cycle protein [Clostridium gasigenes]
MQSIDNKMVDEYVNNVCGLVKNKKVHENIKEELLSHIEEIIEEAVADGKSEEEAINCALLQMGSFDIVGSSLNKVHKAAPDWILLLMTSVFILFSIFTLGFMVKNDPTGLMESPLVRTTICLIIGIVGVFVMLKIDYRSLKKYSKNIYVGTMIISILVLYIATAVNDGFGLICFESISFDIFKIFSITPVLFIFSLAGIFENYDWSNIKRVLIGFALAFLPCMTFIFTQSLTNTIIYTIAVITLITVSGIGLRHILIYTGALGVAFVLYILQAQYRIDRMFSFLRPLDNTDGPGWMRNQIATLRSSAGLFGQGGNYAQDMLPLANSDYILTYIIYTFGWIIGIILLALVLAFIIRIGFVGVNTKNKYGKLIASGFCGLFAAQFLLNILMNLNLSPAFAVGMPFISYSGTGLIINMFTIGIITNVYKWRNTPYITD